MASTWMELGSKSALRSFCCLMLVGTELKSKKFKIMSVFTVKISVQDFARCQERLQNQDFEVLSAALRGLTRRRQRQKKHKERIASIFFAFEEVRESPTWPQDGLQEAEVPLKWPNLALNGLHLASTWMKFGSKSALRSFVASYW